MARARIMVETGEDLAAEFGPEIWRVDTWRGGRWAAAWTGLSYGEARLMLLRLEDGDVPRSD